MSNNPNPSLLDPGQIVKRAFDGTNDRLRVDAEITATIVGPQEVIIDAADDSIRLEDGLGNALVIEADGSINVNAAVTISGVSTAAKQDTGNTSLASIDTKLTSPITVTGPLTDTQLRATPVPVSGTVAVTNLDVALSTRLKPADTLTAVTTVGTITNVVHVDDNSSSITVDNNGTFATQSAQSGTWNVNNISGTVSLPTGASTSANQSTEIASLSSIDSKSTQYFTSSFGPIIPTPGTFGTITELFSIDTAGYSVVNFQIRQTIATGTGADEATFDLQGKNNVSDDWQALPGTIIVGLPPDSPTYITFDTNIIDHGLLSTPAVARYIRGIIDSYENDNGDNNYYADIYVNKQFTGYQPVVIANLGQQFVDDSLSIVLASDHGDVPISVLSLPLPSGASTSAKQDTGNTSLSSIDTKTPSLGQATMANSRPIVIASNQSSISVIQEFSTRSDTFTTTSNGTTVSRLTSPLKAFSVQVKATGTVTSWDVRFEGSLDNSNFSQILQHTNVTPGDGITVFSGSLSAPILYFRSRCAAITLGAGTNIVTTILGMV